MLGPVAAAGRRMLMMVMMMFMMINMKMAREVSKLPRLKGGDFPSANGS